MTSSDFVTLRDGATLPVATLQRLWQLEDRGVRFALDDDGCVLAGPSRLLTDDDRAFLRCHKTTVLHVLATEVPM